MKTLESLWSAIKVLVFAGIFSVGSYNVGVYQTELQYKAIEIEDTAKNTFLETEKLKAETLSLKQEVKEAALKLEPAEIVNIKKYYLLLKHGDGRYELRTGGNPSWRYNNPGKLAYGNFSKMAGAIGKDGPLAIFPDYETGKRALEAYLFESDVFKGLTVSKTISKFAKSEDGYDPKKYTSSVTKGSKFKSSTLLSDFTADDREEFIEKIQEQENWTAGNIQHFDDKKHFEKEGY